MLSGMDRVNSKLANCIKVAESTLQDKEQKSGGGICGGAGETTPRLVRMGPSISRIPQSPSPKPAHTQTPKPVESKSDQDSLPNLIIYATPQGRTVHLRKAQDPNASVSQLEDLPYQ